jgi:tellurium resistance protein TerD
MAIDLSKGGRINLSKAAPSMKKCRVELLWKPNASDTGAEFDLDVSVFGLAYDAAGDPKMLDLNVGSGANFFVFYNNKKSIDGAIVHSGDNKQGAADGSAGEVITIDIDKLDTRLDEISFIVTIFEAEIRKQNFGQVPKASIKLFNDETNEMLASYVLEDDFSMETAVQFGSLFRKDGEISFKAIGAGYRLGLDAFVKGYGGEVS